MLTFTVAPLGPSNSGWRLASLDATPSGGQTDQQLGFVALLGVPQRLPLNYVLSKTLLDGIQASGPSAGLDSRDRALFSARSDFDAPTIPYRRRGFSVRVCGRRARRPIRENRPDRPGFRTP